MIEFQVEGMSRERVMELYYDMVTTGGEVDYHYADENDSDEDPDLDINNLTIGGELTRVVDQISPQYHGPEAASVAGGEPNDGAGAIGGLASTSDELSIEEMTARISNVCSVLCIPEEDAALFLKV